MSTQPHTKPTNWMPPELPYISVVYGGGETIGEIFTGEINEKTGEPKKIKTRVTWEVNTSWRKGERVPEEFRDFVQNMFSPMPLRLLCKTFLIMRHFERKPVDLEFLYERAVIDIVAGKLNSKGKREPFHVTPYDFYHWFTKSGRFRFRDEPWMATLAKAFSLASAVPKPTSAPKKPRPRLSSVEVKQIKCANCDESGGLKVVKRMRATADGVVRRMKCDYCKKTRKYAFQT